MIQESAIKQLNNLQAILLQIKKEDYNLELAILKGASIGKHTRHIIEFYQSLLFDNQCEVINYDKRNRSLILEENAHFALQALVEISKAIESTAEDRPLRLVTDSNGTAIEMMTSLFRELYYNEEHTVHHLAIIGLIIPTHFAYINTDENFGYASSTITFLKAQKTLKQPSEC